MDATSPAVSSADALRLPYRLDPAGGCPHAELARLRELGDVVDVELPGGVPGVAVVGHDALRELLAHPDVAKAPEHFAALRSGQVPEGWPLLAFIATPGLLTADGADHRRLRTLVNRAFTPRRAEGLRPRIVELTARLLDRVAADAADATAAADGTAAEETAVVDLRGVFAEPLPMAVICELLGVDEEYWDEAHALSNRVISTDSTPAEAIAANQSMFQLMTTVVERRTAEPGGDLTSALIGARAEDGDRLSTEELVGTLMTLTVAGNETITHLITNAVRALSAHPDELARVRSGSVGWADVVEETLRWDGPVGFFPFRFPTRDLELGGALIPAGTAVLAGYTAAGRDTAGLGPGAGEFHPAGTSAGHLSFGHGVHFCLGAPLARLEGAIALEQLYTRFPDLAVAVPDDEVPRFGSFVNNGVRSLPVRLGRDAFAEA
ncbi:cytochrome P450 family protein [Actinospica robiniae]|uniref:cytochrome P450 family protein n=1 Tax=Actinospica robiniae TaxID=304901 RepID=UPI000416B74B|nr:cytochrome P450 [Actinospica robiniae]